MSYAHTNNICHRDLKLANLLISDGNQVKIADFGLSAFFRPGQIIFVMSFRGWGLDYMHLRTQTTGSVLLLSWYTHRACDSRQLFEYCLSYLVCLKVLTLSPTAGRSATSRPKCLEILPPAVRRPQSFYRPRTSTYTQYIPHAEHASFHECRKRALSLSLSSPLIDTHTAQYFFP